MKSYQLDQDRFTFAFKREKRHLLERTRKLHIPIPRPNHYPSKRKRIAKPSKKDEIGDRPKAKEIILETKGNHKPSDESQKKLEKHHRDSIHGIYEKQKGKDQDSNTEATY